MLSVRLICVGKLGEKFWADAVKEYTKRLGAYCKLEIIELPEQRLPQTPSEGEIAQALEKEAAVCGQIKALWASRGRTPRAFVDTYGCQQNEADSERIRGMLRASGYEIVDTEEGADCIVISTCAIREHAETRVYGNVGALVHTKNRHPALYKNSTS